MRRKALIKDIFVLKLNPRWHECLFLVATCGEPPLALFSINLKGGTLVQREALTLEDFLAELPQLTKEENLDLDLLNSLRLFLIEHFPEARGRIDEVFGELIVGSIAWEFSWI